MFQVDKFEDFIQNFLYFLDQRYLKYFQMDKQKIPSETKDLQIGRYYRCRPTMAEANIIGEYLVDLEGLNLQFFNLKDFTLFKRLPVISKQDRYCAQLKQLSDKVLVIFGLQKFILFNIEHMQTVETIKTNSFIEKSEIRSNYISILSSDQDSQNKIVKCWKVNPDSGKVEQKYKETQFATLDYEQCTQQNLCMSVILSIEGFPKIYVYWRDTNYMIQVDPRIQSSQKYNRHDKANLTFDLTLETYAEISNKNIVVKSKKTGKKQAELMNQGQKFQQLFSNGSSDKIYSLSNFGLKRWKLESNCSPDLYTSSDKQKINKIFFGPNELIYGLNLQTNTVVIWKNPEQYSSHSFPNETIRKVIKFKNHQAFFLLEASSSSWTQNQQYHVSKYHKLEIYDLSIDNEVAKKAMVKSQHSVDANSIVVTDSDTIRFIVNQSGEEGDVDRKYLLRWTPFIKDQNGKDTKKREIKGAQSFDVIKLYPFNRIIALTFPKKVESFSLFTKQQEQKTQAVLFDHSAKKIGDYDLQGQVLNVQLSEKNLLYAISQNRILIYSIAAENKNRLQKINELQISALAVTPINEFLLIKKQATFLLLDSEFECIMREETKAGDKNYKVIPVSADKFLLKTDSSLQMWDIGKESVQNVEIPECQPNIVEYLDGKILVADKQVQLYDIKLI